MAKNKVAQHGSSVPATPAVPDIVNDFLTLNGRISFHERDLLGSELKARRFVGPNIIEEEGYWYANLEGQEGELIAYRIPYKLTAVLGFPENIENKAGEDQ